MLWYRANIKLRMEKYLREHPRAEGMYERPARYKVNDGKKSRIVRLYDDDHECCYDKISQEGLSPMDMRRHIDMLKKQAAGRTLPGLKLIMI